MDALLCGCASMLPLASGADEPRPEGGMFETTVWGTGARVDGVAWMGACLLYTSDAADE